MYRQAHAQAHHTAHRDEAAASAQQQQQQSTRDAATSTGATEALVNAAQLHSGRLKSIRRQSDPITIFSNNDSLPSAVSSSAKSRNHGQVNVHQQRSSAQQLQTSKTVLLPAHDGSGQFRSHATATEQSSPLLYHDSIAEDEEEEVQDGTDDRRIRTAEERERDIEEDESLDSVLEEVLDAVDEAADIIHRRRSDARIENWLAVLQEEEEEEDAAEVGNGQRHDAAAPGKKRRRVDRKRAGDIMCKLLGIDRSALRLLRRSASQTSGGMSPVGGVTSAARKLTPEERLAVETIERKLMSKWNKVSADDTDHLHSRTRATAKPATNLHWGVPLDVSECAANEDRGAISSLLAFLKSFLTAAGPLALAGGVGVGLDDVAQVMRDTPVQTDAGTPPRQDAPMPMPALVPAPPSIAPTTTAASTTRAPSTVHASTAGLGISGTNTGTTSILGHRRPLAARQPRSRSRTATATHTATHTQASCSIASGRGGARSSAARRRAAAAAGQGSGSLYGGASSSQHFWEVDSMASSGRGLPFVGTSWSLVA